jgi:fructosamine-3-kinase
MEPNEYSSDSESDDEDKPMKNDISNLKKSMQKYTLGIVENIQRKFMETNWIPHSEAGFSNQRISHQMEEFKRKHGSENKEILDTVFLTSFGVLGIYLFYKMLEKNSM